MGGMMRYIVYLVLCLISYTADAYTGNLAGNNASPFGFNLGGSGCIYYNTEFAFNNLMKCGSGWVTQTSTSGNSETHEEACLQLDSNGYVTTLAPNSSVVGCSSATYTSVGVIINFDIPAVQGTYPSGLYDIYWDNSSFGTLAYAGDISCTGVGTSCAGAGHDIVNVATPTSAGIHISISAITGGGNYPKNFRVYQHAYAAIGEAGEIFNPNFMSMLSNACSFRLIDWWHTNYNEMVDYSQFVPESYAFWSGGGFKGNGAGFYTNLNGTTVAGSTTIAVSSATGLVAGQNLYGGFNGPTSNIDGGAAGYPFAGLNVTGAASGTGGAIELTVSSNSLVSGDVASVQGIGGTVEANGNWPITIIDSTHMLLQGSTFAHTYTSGGAVYVPDALQENTHIVSVNPATPSITVDKPAVWTSKQAMSVNQNIQLNNGMVPPSVIYKMANEAKVDPWVNIPVWSTDAFNNTLAATMLAGLTNNQFVYLEYVDEPWNGTPIQASLGTQGGAAWAFSVTGTLTAGNPVVPVTSVAPLVQFMNVYNPFAFSTGTSQIASVGTNSITLFNPPTQSGSFTLTGPTTLPALSSVYSTSENFYGYRNQQICNDWKTVWGAQSYRIVCMVSEQYNNTGTAATQLDCLFAQKGPASGACASGIDAIAIAWYWQVSVPHAFLNDTDGGYNRYFTENMTGGAITPSIQSVTFNGTSTATPTDTTQLILGETIQCPSGLPTGTTISGNVTFGAGTISMSNAATVSGSVTCRFYITGDEGGAAAGMLGYLNGAKSGLASYNLPFVGYEGGNSVQDNTGDSAMATFYVNARADARTAALAQHVADAWKNWGGKSFNWYASIYAAPWYMMTNLSQYNAVSPGASTAPQWNGSYNYVQERPGCRQGIFGSR